MERNEKTEERDGLVEGHCAGAAGGRAVRGGVELCALQSFVCCYAQKCAGESKPI